MPDTVVPMPNIGKKIRRVRESVLRISQNKFAKLLGVSRGAVGNWELGKGVKTDNLNKIQQLTGVSVDWLMNAPEDAPIQFVSTAAGQEIAAIVEDVTLAVEDVIKGLALVLQVAARVTEHEAEVLAQIVLEAIRMQLSASGEPMSLRDKRLLIETALKPFGPK